MKDSQGHRRHQQGRGGADLPGRRLTAWSAICSRSCRSSPPSSKRRQVSAGAYRGCEGASVMDAASARPLGRSATTLDRLRHQAVGVIGAGQMGNGIAHVCALAGLEVDARSMSATERIDRRRSRRSSATWRARWRAAGITRRRREGAPWRASRRRRLRAVRRLRHGRSRPPTENEDGQARDLQELIPQLKPDAMIATNTSSISITRLAAATDRPERSSACIS